MGLFMCRIASLFLLQRLKGSMSGEARFQQHGDASYHQVFFFLQGKAPKEIHAILAILKETLEEHAPSYATVENWAAQFKRGGFSTCDAPRPGRPKTMTTPEIIDQIHQLILEDRRISAKSIAEQLGNSRERVWSIMHEDLDMRNLSAKWVPKRLNANQKFHGTSRLSNFWNIFGAIQMISCRDWWPWTKPGYITMTRRQSNNQWSGGIAVHPAPKKIPNAKIRWKSSCLDFLGSRQHPPHRLSSKRPNWCNWRTFWRKKRLGKVTKGSCSCTTVLRLTGHL